MKNTTQQIYNKVISETFKNMPSAINNILSTKGLSLPNINEYSQGEVNNDIEFILETLQEVCENRKLDEYSLTIRNSVMQQLNTISTYLNNSVSTAQSNHFNALIAAIDDLKQFIISNSLSLKRSNIPSYNQKLKEFDQLNGKLKQFNDELKSIKQNASQLKSWYTSSSGFVKAIEDTLKESKQLEDNIEKIRDKAESLEAEAKRNINNITSDRQDIMEIKEVVGTIKQKVVATSEEIDAIIEKMEEHIQDGIDTQLSLENEWKQYQNSTEKILSKNKELTFILEEQIQKATGSGLFGVFEKRKSELQNNLYNWLIASAMAVLALMFLSYNVIQDVKQDDFNKWLFITKIIGSFPLVFIIYFTASRFTKERRLIEEYAFKSTISFALEPYSKLVEKLQDYKDAPEYKRFIIDSIRDIFSSPTDKVFTKEDKNPLDAVEKSIEQISKIQDKVKNM